MGQSGEQHNFLNSACDTGTPIMGPYTEDAGLDVTAGIPVKLRIAHGRSRPEVGSGFPIEAYGSTGVSRPSLLIWNS